MHSAIISVVRACQLIFGLVVLGLSAYIANWYNVDTLSASPSQVNWLLAVSLYTIVSIIYIMFSARFLPRFHSPYAVLALEFTNMLFYFAGFIALSVFMSQLLFCRGMVCSVAQADVAFGAMEFLLWAGTAILMAIDMSKSGSLSLKDMNLRRMGKRGQAPLDRSQMKEASLA